MKRERINLFNLTEVPIPGLIQAAEDLVAQNAVTKLRQVDKNLWHCTVNGHDIYHIELLIKGNLLHRYSCDCNVGYGNRLCSHVLAGLMTLEKLFRQKSKRSKIVSINRKLNKLDIQKIKVEDIVEFVKDYLKDSSDFKSILDARFLCEQNSDHIDQIVLKLLEPFFNIDGKLEIEPRHLKRFKLIIYLLLRQSEGMIKNNQFSSALQLRFSLLTNLNESKDHPHTKEMFDLSWNFCTEVFLNHHKVKEKDELFKHLLLLFELAMNNPHCAIEKLINPAKTFMGSSAKRKQLTLFINKRLTLSSLSDITKITLFEILYFAISKDKWSLNLHHSLSSTKASTYFIHKMLEFLFAQTDFEAFKKIIQYCNKENVWSEEILTIFIIFLTESTERQNAVDVIESMIENSNCKGLLPKVLNELPMNYKSRLYEFFTEAGTLNQNESV